MSRRWQIKFTDTVLYETVTKNEVVKAERELFPAQYIRLRYVTREEKLIRIEDYFLQIGHEQIRKTIRGQILRADTYVCCTDLKSDNVRYGRSISWKKKSKLWGMSWRMKKYYIDISVSWLKWTNRCIVSVHCRSLICRKLIQNSWQTPRQIHQLRTLYNGSQILLSYLNNAHKYKLISFQGIDVDWVMQISEQAFVPISSTYKKQAAKSHSRTEAEIIFLKTHLWMHDSYSSIVWEKAIVDLESLDSFYDIWDNSFLSTMTSRMTNGGDHWS